MTADGDNNKKKKSYSFAVEDLGLWLSSIPASTSMLCLIKGARLHKIAKVQPCQNLQMYEPAGGRNLKTKYYQNGQKRLIDWYFLPLVFSIG